MLAARQFPVALSIVAMWFFLAGGLASVQQAAIDPKSLIGECMGTWEYNRASGAYSLTLTRLENGIYYGTAWTSGAVSNPPLGPTV